MPVIRSLRARLAANLRTSCAAGLAIMAIAPGAARAETVPSLADRFQIGSGAMALCSAQLNRRDAVASGIFDRAYDLVCRDARLSLGRFYVLRTNTGDPQPRLDAAWAQRAQCQAPVAVRVEDIGEAFKRECTSSEFGVSYVIYEARKGNEVFVAEGLAGYDTALTMGLRSLVLDRQVSGDVPLAMAGSDDPAAFARAIAGSLDPVSSRAEGYRSNFGGEYLEAAEYFGEVRDHLDGTTLSLAENSLNEALQQSNLGRYAAADRLFAESAEYAADPLLGRLRRNYLALHQLNQGNQAEAIAIASRPVSTIEADAAGAATIDETLAARLNSETPFVRALGLTEPPPLTRSEREAILDAQAAYIRGAALRLSSRPDEARQMLVPALASLSGIRGGRVASVYWLRAQMEMEMAMLDEQAGSFDRAGQGLRSAASLMASQYAGTTSALTSQLRLAGFLARRGNSDEALSLYRDTVRDAVADGKADALPSGLGPYFGLLEGRSLTDPGNVGEYFFASQLLVRPGIARSQLEFARMLSTGSDEAAGLFRASSQISREINRLRLERARRDVEGPAEGMRPVADIDAEIARLEIEQTATQARLNGSARYQVATALPVSLAELRSALKPGEVYYKVFFADGVGHGLVATAKDARIVPLQISEAQAGRAVARLRDSISREIEGETYVMPFDVETAWKLDLALIAPIASELGANGSLIFDPDGALLSLPVGLLVTDEIGMRAYLARAKDPKGDPYDFRGVSWLGREHAISTTVSPRALQLVRSLAPTSAPKSYLGFGENAPVSNVQQAIISPDNNSVCSLPARAWSKPISDTELLIAQGKLHGSGEVVTGAAFSDTAIENRADLDQYRILHFATHGLVTPPGSECVPQPALMTSWGGPGSDGLLSFREVFGLKINADIVILSACDTASGASEQATQQAIGELTGGGFALDGLVRAFTGAGAHAVIASHWPVPEAPIDATSELMSNLFGAPSGESVASALKDAQVVMMDKAETSHPYYWAAFTIVGDGGQPLISGN